MSSLVVNYLFYSLRVRFESVQDGNESNLVHNLGIQLLFHLFTQPGAFDFVCASDPDFNELMSIEGGINLSKDSFCKTVLTDHNRWFQRVRFCS